MYRSTRAFTATLALGAALLAGCGGSAGSTSVASNGADSGRQAQPAAAGPEAASASGGAPAIDGQAASDGKAIAPAPNSGTQVARTASLTLTVDNVAAVAAKVRTIAAGSGGTVFAENLNSADPGQGLNIASGDIVLSVPSATLDATLDQLAALGTVEGRTTSSEDVTSQTVDTSSRLTTMRASVERVRTLMGKATTLGDVVQLESELAKREAALESLESQLAALKARVAESPVTVHLATKGVAIESDNAFLKGLKSGWDAFAGAVQVLLTLLGALLPFALVAALIGWPVWALVQRRRAAATPTAVHGNPYAAGPVAAAPQPAMASAPSAAAHPMHQVDDPGEHIGVGAGQDAVAEVEDVTGRG